VDEDYRAFALSTPRLGDDRSLELKVPFAHGGLDELFRMRHVPQTFGYVKERLGVRPEQEELFSTFFTEEESRAPSRYSGEGVRARYLGHACVLLETRDVSILIDPAISYHYENGIERYTFLDLPEVIDYVLITHGHQDHLMFESLLQLKHKVRHIVVPRSRGGCLEDPSLRHVLRAIGFPSVVEVEEMETIPIEGGTITGLPFLGEHADLNVSSKIAHLIRFGSKTFLFAADSNNLEPAVYRHVFKHLGNINVMFLGMECDGAPMSWLYGPLLTKPLERKMDQSRRFSGSNYERGMGIVNQFNCEEVYVYAMGQEPWLTYVMSIKYTDDSTPIVDSDKLVWECRERGMQAERLFGKKDLFYTI
jgi:L-ascorbate metabolism protein UlaG (beta-lactamase superfamily)